MRVVSEFPRPIREIMTQWIPMPDGCHLAARIWLPLDAETDPVPAVLEYLPYRRRDGTAMRDAVNQPYLAGHGYAAVRVDVRGTSDSQGILTDEYDAPEMADGVAIIAWLADQTWCSGRVGMWGISWGGINALQVAAQAPPALCAIMPMGFTHDRYNGDCHHMGGCLLEGTMSWGNTLLAGTSRPPDPDVLGPDVVGPGWRAQWLARLEATQHPIAIWLSHQRRDDYWKPGSVCEDPSRIKAAVYAVSGWQDSYSRNVFPLVAALSSPWKALIGPWAHGWPHMAVPGPQIGFLQEALRWWDHWLKDIDTGIMDEPRVRVWLGRWAQPRKHVPDWPGRWVAYSAWPPPDAARALHLTTQGGLSETPPPSGAIAISTPQTHGLTAGYQCSYGLGPDLPDDQRTDDALACCFDTAPLDHDIDLCGTPSLTLELSSDEPQAMIAARLCEVAPDGASLRLSYGLLNLSHRNGPENPAAMEPGQRVLVRLELCPLAHHVQAGHRLRLALSTTYWPIAWPSPSPATLTLSTGHSALHLPVSVADADAAPCPIFAAPEGAAPTAVRQTRPRRSQDPQDRITHDTETGNVLITRDRDRGAWHATDANIAYDATGVLTFHINAHDPQTARQEFTLTTTIGRPGWHTSTTAWSRLTATREAFVLEASLAAFENETPIYRRDWTEVFPRDHI